MPLKISLGFLLLKTYFTIKLEIFKYIQVIIHFIIIKTNTFSIFRRSMLFPEADIMFRVQVEFCNLLT